MTSTGVRGDEIKDEWAGEEYPGGTHMYTDIFDFSKGGVPSCTPVLNMGVVRIDMRDFVDI